VPAENFVRFSTSRTPFQLLEMLETNPNLRFVLEYLQPERRQRER